jgi:hypothetical protein
VQQIERDGFQRCQTKVYIYTTVKFLALQGAPHIHDISKLKVNVSDMYVTVGQAVMASKLTGQIK